MGNHSDTGELLEEASMIALTEGNGSFGDTLVDEFGNAIKLDRSPEELVSPARLKDSSGRDVELMRNDLPKDRNILTQKQFDAMQAKHKKKNAAQHLIFIHLPIKKSRLEPYRITTVYNFFMTIRILYCIRELSILPL